MNPGELKHLITFERAVLKVDEDNIPVKEYEKIYTCRAKIYNISGKEVILNQGESLELSKRFIIRYTRSVKITNTDRIIYNGETYEIKYIHDVKENRTLLEIVGELFV